eukprot:SAG31_NODE_4010_length_3667_cov_2.004484_7_plen_97_part_00
MNTHDYQKNATMTVSDVHRELKHNHATWVSNMAHSVFRDAAAAALATQTAFGLPAHSNVYCTGAATDVSLAPHTGDPPPLPQNICARCGRIVTARC